MFLENSETTPTAHTQGYHTLNVSIRSTESATRPTNHAHTITVKSLNENHIRYTLANTIHQPPDALCLHIHEQELWVQCTVQNSTPRVSLRVVFLNKDGHQLLRTSMTLLPTVPLSTTLFAIVHHPRVRRWLYTTQTLYSYITPFLHTQLFTAHSLAHHTHLQPNDTLYCIMTTVPQEQQLHDHIHTWVDELYAHQKATLKYMHIIRQQLYTEERYNIPYTASFRLSAFHSHVWLQWVQRLGFLYTIDRLRKSKRMDKWLSMHCTLLANSLWNDYAYHTNKVFGACAEQCLLQETQKWKYTLEHWDVLCMSLRASPTGHYLLHTMRCEHANTQRASNCTNKNQ
jgi:hypothetical protein